MASIDEQTLEKMVKVMKQHGVLHFQQEGLTITLDPSRLYPEAEPEKEEERPPVAVERKRGNDGLTGEDQELLYGRAYDGE